MSRIVLDGRLILIVEGEAWIALDIARAFGHAGARVVTASTLRDALLQVDSNSISAAILDHRLGSREIAGLCERLKARAIPFVIYSDHERIAGACLEGPLVHKPADPAVLVTAVKSLLSTG